MKTAIVYFSLTGNVDFAARRIAERLGADLIAIAPETPYPSAGFAKFFHGGKAAVFGEAPALKPCGFDPSAYERIIFGTPVWAGTFAPPLRRFIREFKPAWRATRFAAFACSSGGSAEKALDRLLDEIGAGALEARLSLVDPKRRPDAANDARLDQFCRSLQQK